MIRFSWESAKMPSKRSAIPSRLATSVSWISPAHRQDAQGTAVFVRKQRFDRIRERRVRAVNRRQAFRIDSIGTDRSCRSSIRPSFTPLQTMAQQSVSDGASRPRFPNANDSTDSLILLMRTYKVARLAMVGWGENLCILHFSKPPRKILGVGGVVSRRR